MNGETVKRKVLLFILFLYLWGVIFGNSNKKDNDNYKSSNTYTKDSFSHYSETKSKSTSSSSKSKSNKSSSKLYSNELSNELYDAGYDDVMEDSWYSENVYDVNKDYEQGVDDAIEDWDEEFPDDKDIW